MYYSTILFISLLCSVLQYKIFFLISKNYPIHFIELPRHIDVEVSYFSGQYFASIVELPCYPPSS